MGTHDTAGKVASSLIGFLVIIVGIGILAGLGIYHAALEEPAEVPVEVEVEIVPASCADAMDAADATLAHLRVMFAAAARVSEDKGARQQAQAAGARAAESARQYRALADDCRDNGKEAS